MKVITPEKFERFKKIIETMNLRLQLHGSLRVQEVIDESYYLEKKEELTILQAQWEEARDRLDHVEHMIALHYTKTYCRWRREVRWLSAYLQQREDV